MFGNKGDTRRRQKQIIDVPPVGEYFLLTATMNGRMGEVHVLLAIRARKEMERTLCFPEIYHLFDRSGKCPTGHFFFRRVCCKRQMGGVFLTDR